MSSQQQQALDVIEPPATPRNHGRVTLVTFGFKYGPPPTNYSFDVSFVRNPARDPRWGMFARADDQGMREFVLEQPQAESFLKSLIPLIEVLSRCDDDLRVGLGCNAGRHRSRIIAAEVQRRLQAVGIEAHLIHREELLS
ncbi:MAG: RNase adapter RapZ [Myxococcota bacterium]